MTCTRRSTPASRGARCRRLRRSSRSWRDSLPKYASWWTIVNCRRRASPCSPSCAIPSAPTETFPPSFPDRHQRLNSLSSTKRTSNGENHDRPTIEVRKGDGKTRSGQAADGGSEVEDVRLLFRQRQSRRQPDDEGSARRQGI